MGAIFQSLGRTISAGVVILIVIMLIAGTFNKLGDMNFSIFPQMWGGWGVEVREASKIAPALKQAREMVAKTGKSAVINIWVDPNEYAPGTKNQTMYK